MAERVVVRLTERAGPRQPRYPDPHICVCSVDEGDFAGPSISKEMRFTRFEKFRGTLSVPLCGYKPQLKLFFSASISTDNWTFLAGFISPSFASICLRYSMVNSFYDQFYNSNRSEIKPQEFAEALSFSFITIFNAIQLVFRSYKFITYYLTELESVRYKIDNFGW